MPIRVRPTATGTGGSTAEVACDSPIILSLPWKVLVPDNQRHEVLRTKGGGRRIGLTEKYRNALAVASMLAAQQWHVARQTIIKTPVCINIVLHEPDKRRRDVGNYVKLLADCLIRVCFVDDSQIDELYVKRGSLDRYTPRADIEVRPLP